MVGVFREGVNQGVEVGSFVFGAYSKGKFPGVMVGEVESCGVRSWDCSEFSVVVALVLVRSKVGGGVGEDAGTGRTAS